MDLYALFRRTLEEVLKWQLIGKNKKRCAIFFSIAFFMGDTVEHNKLCCLCGGPNAICPCEICDCCHTMLDQPVLP